jgi:hypothetical protein
LAGKPTVRRAQLPGANRMTEKRMPVAERQRKAVALASPPAGGRGITGRIPGQCARTRKRADAVR